AWMFGLPGNPVAAMVAFWQFVRPALIVMAGRREHGLPCLPVRLATAIRKKPGRTEFQRGVVSCGDGHWTVRTTGRQGSGILRSMAEANCLIVLEHERGDVAIGEMVNVQLLAGLL
ncbi:MAG: molybdopterin molybdenumtransferase MoeA, partial [Chloroflexota bacterium]